MAFHRSLRHNRMESEGVSILCEALKKNINVTTLDLGENLITAQGLKSITELLSMNHNIEELGLSGNSVQSDQEWIQLFSALKGNKNLKKLFLSYNTIGDVSIKELCNVINGTLVKILDLEGNHITSEGGELLLDMLSKNTSLTEM
eukprot:Sdes_comp20697_c0_seq1m16293